MNSEAAKPSPAASGAFASLSIKRLGALLREWPNRLKIAAFVVTDLIALIVIVFFSHTLRVSSLELPPTSVLPQYLIAPILSVACIGMAGIYGVASRGFSRTMDARLLFSQIPVAILWMIALFMLGTTGFARSVVIIYLVLSVLALIMLRRGVAWMVTDRLTALPVRDRIPVLIYGAGRHGASLADTLKRQGRYRPLAFIDTDYTLFSRTVSGLRVNPLDQLDEVVAKYRPREVMIAKPNQSRHGQRLLVDRLLVHGLTVKTVPGIEEIADGRINVSSIRPVRVEDLLGRDPVPPDVRLMHKAVREKVVLITGAGGSIGSELVRQVFAYAPTKVVLLERSEYALFEIHREMEAVAETMSSPPALVPVLADVLDRKEVRAIMQKQKVDAVFHAAAYKHVRMVQENASSGILNNIWGTINVAEEAVSHGVKLFVLISTDKAVRPTSVMGATKRVAEMYIQALATRPNLSTVFAIVRFGNVLGSSGSVVPLFREQIGRGGPVRVTHQDATRYFMLISEAAQLVIQASAMAEKGEVFVLDMGEPVKILQLAETMIELAGMTVSRESHPEGDVAIEITGLRDGEKLHEELQIGTNITNTEHPRIMRSEEVFMSAPALRERLKTIEVALTSNDQRATDLLTQLALYGMSEPEVPQPQAINV